ncbi:PEP-CTERM/exosortase system-associated acyltransferase [Spartinivicinus poritis]|uniref:PEP-CTERM/exosortase system-associated acyltransferase n=1 Tax=Spartinivicinus poritis TaxID=2994640 RepID=A0ABT5UEI2_9GAMM|nr:PEP-CTERM/exosortase system-associated acyltransferase [Spartinivicinus sp. A2-2]MDE1464595.1 PEP-CTERM/exosortase system-associated acyltransferase [Spartinivicinus sp. A2-2]
MLNPNAIVDHFYQYFKPVLASNLSLVQHAYRIRCDVYCKELKFEPDTTSDFETDDFDHYAQHVLIEHLSSQSHAGCVRLVVPPKNNRDAQLPLEKYCYEALDKSIVDIDSFERGTFGEISRLAVKSQFRRRSGDSKTPTGAPEVKQTNQAEERRNFPFIAVSLYLSVTAIAKLNEIEHVFVMMEPRLAKHLGMMGITFQQIGPVVDYHGRRAPYYINEGIFHKNLPHLAKPFFERVYSDLADQFSPELSIHNMSHQRTLTVKK